MAFLRNFPALILGLVCLAISFLCLDSHGLQVLVMSWTFGLISVSLFYAKQPSGLVYFFVFGAVVLLLTSLTASAGLNVTWLSIFVWLCLQLLLLSGLRFGVWGAYLAMSISVGMVVLLQGIDQLPQEVSKPDFIFVLLWVASFVPTLTSLVPSSKARQTWVVLGIQSLFLRLGWIFFGTGLLNSQVGVLDFNWILTGSILILLVMGLQSRRPLRTSLQLQTAATLFFGQLALGAKGSIVDLLIVIAVPFTLAPLLGPKNAGRSPSTTSLLMRLDSLAMGSPFLLGLISLAGYHGPETFPFLVVSAGALLLLSAQLWSETEGEFSLGSPLEFLRTRQLSRYSLYAVAVGVLLFELARYSR